MQPLAQPLDLSYLQGHPLCEAALKLHSFKVFAAANKYQSEFCEFLSFEYLNSSGEINHSVTWELFESRFGLGTSQVFSWHEVKTLSILEHTDFL